MSRLSAPLRHATSKRSRRAIVAATLVLGGTVIAVEGSTATFAAEREAPSLQPLNPTGLATAHRVKPPKPTPAPEPAPASAPITDSSSQERRVTSLTNEARAAAGLAPLQVNANLNAAALAHAMDQRNQPCAAGFLTHTGTDGSNGAERIQRTGLRISRWGENIACAFRTADAVTNGWLGSPGHRANMMNAQFTHTGVAIGVSNSGQLYWVQTFATLR